MHVVPVHVTIIAPSYMRTAGAACRAMAPLLMAILETVGRLSPDDAEEVYYRLCEALEFDEVGIHQSADTASTGTQLQFAAYNPESRVLILGARLSKAEDDEILQIIGIGPDSITAGEVCFLRVPLDWDMSEDEQDEHYDDLLNAVDVAGRDCVLLLPESSDGWAHYTGLACEITEAQLHSLLTA